jgi:hypothetical protein
VPELCPCPHKAPVGRAVEDQPAADPGPEREHDHVARAMARTDAPLGDCGCVPVVVDAHRERETLVHPVTEVEVGQRDVRGRDRAARALVDRGRDPKAERSHVLAQ